LTSQDFDTALITSAFAIAAKSGWKTVSVLAAAREAGLPLEQARARFSCPGSILARFGRLADEQALTGALDEGSTRERLFDVLMRRFDALQAHRAGVLALLHHLPADPPLAMGLAASTAASMGWMLDAAGVAPIGLRGAIAVQGLVAVWFYTLRAWEKDDTADVSATMAALDRALDRAEQAARWVQRAAPEPAPAGPKPFPEPEIPPLSPLGPV